MIKGLAKMEFGTGDILMTAALSDGVGALCCCTQEPHEIGERVPNGVSWNPEKAEVILTFTKVESIDSVIAELTLLRSMMDGSYDFKSGHHTNMPFLDFDTFIRSKTGSGDSLKEDLNNRYGINSISHRNISDQIVNDVGGLAKLESLKGEKIYVTLYKGPSLEYAKNLNDQMCCEYKNNIPLLITGTNLSITIVHITQISCPNEEDNDTEYEIRLVGVVQ